MDDPWGSSPWADEVQLPIPTNTEQDAPPPTTPVRAPKLGLEEKIASPWGDEGDNDTFGDWAALPGDQEETSGLDGAANDWGNHLADTGDLTAGRTNALSVNWEGQNATEHEGHSILAPSPFPGDPVLMRQPSPDPWALDEQEKEKEPEDILDVARPDEETGDSVTVLKNKRPTSPGPNVTQYSHEKVVPGTASEDEETTTHGGDSPEELDTHSADPKEHLENSLDGKPGSENQESDLVSRPSSSPSERSHHDELLQESPRTSFDEDPKPNRPKVLRKVSTKVQELVHHFDTLAKIEDPEPVIDRTGNTQVADPREASEEEDDDNGDDDDFGDFEEGQSDDEVLEPEDSQPLENVVSQRSSIETPQHRRVPSLENTLSKDYGVVKYEFEPSKLDDIFLSDTPNSTTEKVFIMDSIPFESFSSPEERKAWYRISRYGTMRKHNSGNDENYVRVSWKPSTIRDDTLKIVSRWIEEDRISGRVVLGGGSRGSTVFGWNDPKAPAVPLSEVFVKHGKKMSNMNPAAEVASEVPREWPKGLVRDRSTSKTRSPSSKPRRKSSVKTASPPISSNKHDTPIAQVANFGWNSAPESMKATSDLTSFGGMLSGPVSDFAPISNPKSPPGKSRSSHISNLSAPPAAPNVPSQKHTIPAITNIEPATSPGQRNIPLPTLSMSTVMNDDDDWGEMVSTPATPTLPAIPQAKGLRHKKSQSFGGMNSSSSQGFVPEGWMNGQPETSHRLTNSFDEILTPQTLVPASMNPQILSNADLFTAPVDISHTPAQAQVKFTSATSDPWASADFSFFDTPPVPVAAPKLQPVSLPIPASKAANPKTVKFNTPPPALPRGNQRSREELEQDRIVQSVVKGLPDFSYMLRK